MAKPLAQLPAAKRMGRSRLDGAVGARSAPDAPEGGFVARPRLAAMLERGAAGPLTTVTAPAGWGKTATLAWWTSTRSAPTAWITARPGHDESVPLWSAISAALVGCTTVADRRHLATLIRGAASEPSLIDFVCSVSAELATPVTLVIDDAQHIPAAARSLAARLPTGLRVVLGARSGLRLPVGRLRVTGELVEIGPEDLAFTADEAAELFARRRVEATLDQVAALTRSTGGWPAGLRLAERLLATGGDVGGFDGETPEVMDYLRSEVWEQTPADVRDFLLRTSVAERLCADLADAVTGSLDGARMLNRLSRDNLLTPDGAGAGRRWFRAQPLLLRYLRHEARIEVAAQLPALHRRAADWHAQHGDALPALRHARAVDDWSHAARTMVMLGAPALSGEDRAAVLSLFDGAPASVDADPHLAACLALIHAERAEIGPARRLVEAARCLLNGGRPIGSDVDGRRDHLNAMLGLVEVLVARHAGRPGPLAERAERLLATTTTPILRAIASVHAGVALVWRGELAEADEALHVAAGLAHDSGLVLAEADALGHRSLVHALRGRLRAAERTAGAAVTLAGPAGSGWQAAAAHLAGALVHHQRADPDAAAAELDAIPAGPAIGMVATILRAQLASARADVATARALLAAASDQASDPESAPLLRWWLAEAVAAQCLAERRPDAAAAALDLGPAPSDAVLTAASSVSTARVLLARGAATMARAVLAPVHELDVGAVVHTEAWLLDAMAADLLGLEGAVCVALREALAAAQPERVRRPFLAGGPSDLLGRHRDLTRGWSIVDELAGTGDGRRRPDAAETITRREVVVLRYLPTLLTTREIAAEIYVSPNTVKTQLKSIYRKLAVGTRREAVDRARRLGLL